jgi:kynurenine formamidase
MCDSVIEKQFGWKGWIEIPEARIEGSHVPWTDLSHPITETLSRIPFFPQPKIGRWMNYPPVNVTEIHMVVHHGTHFDAPRHFITDGPTIDEVPLDRLYGQGVIWHLDMPPRGKIGVAELERATPKMQRGDIVLIDTGWWKHVNTELYEDHPVLTAEASEWLVAQGAKLVGVESWSPNTSPTCRRSPVSASKSCFSASTSCRRTARRPGWLPDPTGRRRKAPAATSLATERGKLPKF